MAGKYKDEYGEQLVEACKKGHSPTGFAGSIGVAGTTIIKWTERYPEFAEAYSRAQAARTKWLEEQAATIVTEGGTGGQASLMMFLLRNAAPSDYQDRKEITGAGGKPLVEDADPARIAASIIELLRSEEKREK